MTIAEYLGVKEEASTVLAGTSFLKEIITVEDGK
jgi:hypothetical protein